MNPILLYFASGESLYSGAILLLLVVAISPYLTRSWTVRLRNIAIWVALAMILMACPPFAWIIDAIFGAVFLFWFVAWNQNGPGRIWARLRLTANAALLLLLLGLTAVEFSHRRTPVIEGQVSDHLVVIGDSISSGLGARVSPWPTVMQEMTGVEIRNLAQPGAMVIEGRAMVDRIVPEDHLVLIEIGGNDLIAGEPSDVFAGGLDAIMTNVVAPGRTVVMFELPLLPHKIAYGQAQRRLAAKYGIPLIPKRYLTSVIAGDDATLDGLHLTDIGARRMASLVTQILSPVLKTPAKHP